ncbi:gluconolactonase [Bradyrhizobium sp. LM6.9]
MNDASSHNQERPQGWRPATYYPDPAISALDPRFEKYWLKLSAVERLTTGLRWAEGPVWVGDGRYLLCSDIPNQRIVKWEEETGAVSVFRKPSNFANGNTRDRQGRLVTCEHGGRRVTRTEYDGSITVLMDSFGGKKLNSPNDVVVKSDGAVWFTDPTFGLLGNYEGYKAEPEIEPNVYRFDPTTGKATIVAEGVLGPNGLCFSPDEKILYVVESRGVPNRKILAYDVSPDGTTISNKRVHIDAGSGHAGRHAL